jgi:outer membrane immunogenic protein
MNGFQVKNILLTAVSVVAMTSSAFAAEKMSDQAAAVTAEPAPLWTGFYAGINAGYGLGTTATTQNSSWALNDNWAQWESYASRSPTGCNGKNGRVSCSSYTDPNYGTSSIANAGIANLTQGGAVGGAQLGYNYNFLTKYVIGVESDFQGSSIQGSGSYSGLSSDSYSRSNNGKHYYNYSGTRNFVGVGKNDAGLTWLGTARAKVGYLITPYLMLYGSGGLSFGSSWSSSKNYSFALSDTVENDNGSIALSKSILPSMSTGNKNEIRTGYAAGGGFELALTPSWSLKSEAIYYNLGSQNYTSSPIVFYDGNTILTASQNTTQLSYQGIIARGGVNYHFNFEVK